MTSGVETLRDPIPKRLAGFDERCADPLCDALGWRHLGTKFGPLLLRSKLGAPNQVTMRDSMSMTRDEP